MNGDYTCETGMSSHTPGPWKAYGTWVNAGDDGNGPLVADCERDDDAELIAAAPDLLAALETAWHCSGIIDHCDQACRDQIAGAIAKARGQSW